MSAELRGFKLASQVRIAASRSAAAPVAALRPDLADQGLRSADRIPLSRSSDGRRPCALPGSSASRE
ncbi:hypothetical protein SB717_39700, partial [Priestia sp. SIMBA_032]|uniref:hypothetical protein n=1 Tax=Priestia sp. SIMBA_032 TaxID=3085775 RepID=UPI00397B9DFA